MLQLLDAQEARELAILKLLYEEEKWWTVQSLADQLDCSVHTIYRSLNHINEAANEQKIELTIVSQKTRGVYLDVYSHYAINLYSSQTVKHSLGYRLLDRIFQSHDLTVGRLADDFFVSKSTIYRKLKDIEVILKRKKLNFNTNTFEIIGDEVALREFFYSMYWSIVSSEEWPFKVISRAVLVHRIKESKINFSEIEALQMLYRLAVNFIRHKKKKYVSSLKKADYIDPFRADYFKVVKQFNLESIPKQNRKHEDNYLLLTFMIQTKLNLKNFDYNQVNEWHREHNSLPYQISSVLISELLLIYPEEQSLASKELLYQLISSCIYASVFEQLQFSKIFDDEVIYTILNKAPIFSENLELIFRKIYYGSEFKLEHFNFKYFFFKACVIIQNYVDLDGIEKSIKIKLVSITDPSTEEILKNKLNKMTSLHLKINTSNESNDLPQIQYDLILSDLLSQKVLPEQKHSKLYTFAFPPTHRDWQNILNELTKINEKNNKRVKK